jgi:hypothetical protein
MFIIDVPRVHQVGDTMDVLINGSPAKLTWESDSALVIDGTDRRKIYECFENVDSRGVETFTFICGNGADEPDTGPVTIFRA